MGDDGFENAENESSAYIILLISSSTNNQTFMGEKRFEVYAPVIIPTLCRYEHFKRCIDSLSRCTGAEFTDVYIGLDYPAKEEHWEGYKKICEYVKNVSGFNNLFVLIREQNFGVRRNNEDLKEQVKRVSDRYIYSEYDNEFSPNFLEYMNEGLTRYKDNPNIMRICGSKMTWGIDFQGITKGYDKNVFPAKDYNASGVGSWFSKIKKIPYTKTSVLNSWKLTCKAFRKGYCTAIQRMMYQLDKESQLPDVGMRLYCAFHDKYCIFPLVSKVKNWGYDGSGINSDNNIHLIEIQELDTEDSFYMDDIEVMDYPEVNAFVKGMYNGGKKTRLVIMLEYIYYRLTKRSFKNSFIYKTIKSRN
jgi:hypothetical protein